MVKLREFGWRSAHRAEVEDKPLIERNADKLAELEREWFVLGTLRPITFSTYIGDAEEVARNFALELSSLGFKAIVSSSVPIAEWSVHATRSMEPTAANVTEWEEWFIARIEAWEYPDDYDEIYSRSVRFEGWKYPRKLGPAFSLTRQGSSKYSAESRGKILFGETLSYDPVSGKGSFSGFEDVGYRAARFQLKPAEFLTRARESRPMHAEPTASKFAQWIYSLYADAYGTAEDREEGKKAEAQILAARRRAYSSIDAEVLSTSFPDWRLVHNGMHTAHSAVPDYFTVGDLKLAGEALRVLPDLIYRNSQTGEIIIVEIKHSRMPIPANLWPNIWGQLWCYAQLEQVRKAPRVTVIGEVWGDAWTRGNRKVSSSHLVCLRASVRRDPRASAYDRFFRALFNIYRGEY